MRWLWLTLLVLVFDQWTKSLAGSLLEYGVARPLFPSVNLTLVHNTGASFSMLSGAGGWQRGVLIGLALAISVVLFIWLRRIPPGRRWLPAALALILGGALGNLVDRAVLGYVVDFVDLYVGSAHWPAFNAADSAITVGAVMLVVETLWLEPRREKVDRISREI
jgi:signal peptidase II